MSDDSATSVLRAGEYTHNQSISLKVIQAVADREGVDPTELSPLYDAIDPEALDSLFKSKDTDGRVEFHWLGYRIVVYSSGSIRVIEAEDKDLAE